MFTAGSVTQALAKAAEESIVQLLPGSSAKILDSVAEDITLSPPALLALSFDELHQKTYSWCSKFCPCQNLKKKDLWFCQMSDNRQGEGLDQWAEVSGD